MIEAVCEVLRDQPVWGAWAERKEGLATRAIIVRDGKETAYPYSHNTKTCAYDSRITPDEGLKSVLWFEAEKGCEKGFIPNTFECTITLFCWINLKKMGKVNASGDPDRKFTAVLQQDVIRALTDYKGSSSGIKIQKVDFEGEKKKDVRLFSKYDFKKDVHWWFGHFDYFAMDFKVQFSVACDTPILEPEVC